jgi:hypothetical protein
MISINISGNTLLNGGRGVVIIPKKYQNPTVEIDDDVAIPTTIRRLGTHTEIWPFFLNHWSTSLLSPI